MAQAPGIHLHFGFAMMSIDIGLTTEALADNFTNGEVEDIHDFLKTLIETKVSQSTTNTQADNILRDIVIQDPS